MNLHSSKGIVSKKLLKYTITDKNTITFSKIGAQENARKYIYTPDQRLIRIQNATLNQQNPMVHSVVLLSHRQVTGALCTSNHDVESATQTTIGHTKLKVTNQQNTQHT